MAERNDLTREEELQEIEEDMKQPWDRLPSEPEEQYDLFQRFLLQGPKRKVTKVTRMEGVTQHLGTLYRYSRSWRWKERAAYWDRDRARRIDEAMFWIEYETRVRNLEKLDAAVDKLVENVEAAHIENISREKALMRLGPNMNILSRAMNMEERLLRLARRDHCPFCRMR
jgi:hypothetical protein